MHKHFADLSDDAKLIILGIITVAITFIFMYYSVNKANYISIPNDIYVVDVQEPCDSIINTRKI